MRVASVCVYADEWVERCSGDGLWYAFRQIPDATARMMGQKW